MLYSTFLKPAKQYTGKHSTPAKAYGQPVLTPGRYMLHTFLLLICTFSSAVLSSTPPNADSLDSNNTEPSQPSHVSCSDPIVILENNMPAAIQVFVDSSREAPSEDVAKVLSTLPALAGDIWALFRILAQLYRQRCLEVDQFIIIDTFDVYSKPMTTITDFREFVERLSVEDAAKFFMFPPGSLRDAVRNHLLTLNGFCVHLVKELCAKKVQNMPWCPYAEAITDVKDLLETCMTKEDFMKVLPIIPFQNGHNHILFTLLPSRLYYPILMSLPDPAFYWPFVTSKFARPLPCLKGKVLKTYRAELSYISEKNLLMEMLPLYAHVVNDVLLVRPETLFFELDAIDDEQVEAVVSKNCEHIISQTVFAILIQGLKIPMFEGEKDRKRVEQVLSMVRSPFDRQFYRRVLLPEVKVVSKHPLSDYFGCVETLPITLADSPVYQNLTNSICNPHNFFRLITEGERCQEGKISMLLRFIGGYSGPVCKFKRILGIKMLNHVLSDDEKNMIASIAYQRSPIIMKIDLGFEPYPIYKQKHILSSLVFRTGSFAISNGGNGPEGVRAQIFEAFEVVASIIFPRYMEKCLAVRDMYGQTPLIEDLLMSGFIDMGWILEHYGNINDDISNPTCILRLVDESRDDVIQSFSTFVKLLFQPQLRFFGQYKNDCRVRVAELIKYLYEKGKMDKVSKILKGIPIRSESIVNALEHKPVVEPDSDYNILLALLSDYTAYPSYDTKFWAPRLKYLRPDIAAEATYQIVVKNELQREVFTVVKFVRGSCPSKYLANLIKRLFDYVNNPDTEYSDSKRIASIAFKLIESLPNPEAVSAVFNHIWPLDHDGVFDALNEDLDITWGGIYVNATENPSVCLEFKVFILAYFMQSDAPELRDKIAVNVWKHIFELFGEEKAAKAFLIAELADHGVELIVEYLDEILLDHNSTQQERADHAKTPKIGSFTLVHCCPLSVPIYVEGRLVFIPDNASTAHLYSTLQHIFDLNTPFQILDKRTMKVIDISEDVSVKALVNARLIIAH